MKISVIGTSYVGLVTGISLAIKGNQVVCVGRNLSRIRSINRGIAPFYEPGLHALLKKALAKKSFTATDKLEDAILDTEVTLIAVGTPTVRNRIDLSSINGVIKKIGAILKYKKKYHVVAIKSTVLPTTTEKIIKPLLESTSGKKIGKEIGLCTNPEFLREGNAVEDSLKPDRIVIGTGDTKSFQILKEMYSRFSCPVIRTSSTAAEMIKYTSNALLATLISFSNEIARVCESIGGLDSENVWNGVHLDHRLNPDKGNLPEIVRYIRSGCGYGGSCFPKDTQALSSLIRDLGIGSNIIQNVVHTNNTQPHRLIMLLKHAVGKLKGKKIAVFGLAFKPNTDDLRESPALKLIHLLIDEGADIVCHDPVVSAAQLEKYAFYSRIMFEHTISDALKNADAAVFATAWDMYKKLKPDFFKKYMEKPVIVDGRRMFDKNTFLGKGIIYQGIGYRI